MADIIRQMIIKKELKTDQRISERQLSQKFGISTAPVKEALRILQTEGLVRTIPRVGTFVAGISDNHIYQIVAMRGALEGVAANFAAQRRSDDDIRQMTGLLDEVEANLNQGLDSQKISKLNESFHKILREASQNDYLINLIRTMNSIDRTIRSLSFEVKDADSEAQRAYNEHRAILQAIISQNSELAEQRMNQHIRRVANEVVNNN